MTTRRELLRTGLAGGAVLTLTFGVNAPAWAQSLTNLEIFVPAAPGGGWDATARAMEAAFRADGIITEIKVEHVAGAGGMTGLPAMPLWWLAW
jgi:putative tricarboxylic transport membrane protein